VKNLCPDFSLLISGGVYALHKHNANYYIVVESITKTAVLAYTIYNIDNKDFDMFPVHIKTKNVFEFIGIIKTFKHSRIPNYKQEFIDLCPEYFI